MPHPPPRGPPGTQHRGNVSWYVPNGYGACGWSNGANDLVVAVSYEVFDSSLCGKKVLVMGNADGSWSGGAVTVTVVDRCGSCGPNHIDISRAAFQQLRDPIVGRFYTTWLEGS